MSSAQGGKRKISDFFAVKKKSDESEESAAKRIKKEEILAKKKAAQRTRALTLLNLVKDEAWRLALEPEAEKQYLFDLVQFLTDERNKHTVYPKPDLVFAALNACTLAEIKVVIVGQDPYHGPGQANGLAFSIEPTAKCKYPPSLRNLLAEVRDDTGAKIPEYAKDLSRWARQGVLLLNTVLTVRASQANSHHKRGWELLTDAIIRAIDKRPQGAVFLLWGKPALTKCDAISKSKHRIIVSSHPSPLSNTKTDKPFTGSKCFSRCNTYLKELGYENPIDWSLEYQAEDETAPQVEETEKAQVEAASSTTKITPTREDEDQPTKN